MDTPNYYPGINNPSTSYGYYGHQQPPYIPNYYVDDSSDEGSNINYHQKISGMPHSYYEPMFHPPSSLYYSHNYPRHSVELHAPCNPPAHSLSNQNPWYQPPQPGSQPEQMLSMVQFTNSNGREARNRAEKNRRDKLNGSIQELSTMVPHVAESPRRVDKTAVLRFSAHGLRLQYIFGKTLSRTPPIKPQVTDSLMRLLDSFLITVTCRGQIVLISPSVEQHLGHCQTDLFGQNILHITHPDDHAMLKKQLIPTELEKLFDIQPEDESGEPRPRTQEEEDEIDRKLREDKRMFSLRLARAGPRSEPTTYELVKIDGCFRRADSAPRGVKASTFPSGLQLIRRARGRDDSIPLHTISGNDIVLVALARVIKPPKCDRMVEPNHGEYQTRHLIDGSIIECDQRISLVAGYMTEEVNGASPFTFMHQDDVRWVIVALRQMYDCNSEYGESCYRLLTRNGEFIYLRTRGYMEIDKYANVVRTFLCINTLLTEEEGKRRVQEMKNKLTVIVNTTIPDTPAIDAPAAANPLQLERAIIYLIQNLQTPEDNDNDDAESRVSNHGSETDTNRHTKSPPLALIPPKPSTIKSSITRSVNIVNITVARSLRAHQRSPARLEEIKSPDGKNDKIQNQTRPSVLQKSGSPSIEPNGFRSREEKNSFPSASNISPKPDIVGESRVPPLPNSKGYFDISSPSSSPTSIVEGNNISPTRFSYPKVIHQQTSVLKRIRSPDDYGENSSNLAKRRTIEIDKEPFLSHAIEELTDSTTVDLNQVLVSSFEEIGQSLANIGNVTSELQDQRSAFPVDPASQHQLEEIIEEQQEQREILENIKNEYEAHIHSVTDTNIPVVVEEEPRKQKELKPR